MYSGSASRGSRSIQRDEEAAAALEVAMCDEQLGELERRVALGRQVAVALGAAAQPLEAVDQRLGDALLVELVRLGEIADGRGVVAELLAERWRAAAAATCAGALHGGERFADRALRGIELTGGGERRGLIGDELGDVRRALASLAQDLGSLERLTEEPE